MNEIFQIIWNFKRYVKVFFVFVFGNTYGIQFYCLSNGKKIAGEEGWYTILGYLEDQGDQ